MCRVSLKTPCLALAAVLLWSGSTGAADLVMYAAASRGPAGLPVLMRGSPPVEMRTGLPAWPQAALAPLRDDSFPAALRSVIDAQAAAAAGAWAGGRALASQALEEMQAASAAASDSLSYPADLEGNAFMRLLGDFLVVSQRAQEARRAIDIDMPLPPWLSDGPATAPAFPEAAAFVPGTALLRAAEADRMLVVAPTGWRAYGEPVQAAAPRREGIAGPWREGKGVRFRVRYLRPEGVSRVDEYGLHFELLGRRFVDPSVHIPSRYWGRDYAVYPRRCRVAYEIEIQNTGSSELHDLAVLAAQEEFNPRGGMGRMLWGGQSRLDVGSLKPGETAVLTDDFRTAASSDMRGNFEQTHLIVAMRTALGTTEVLGDEPQAALVDPPTAP